MIIDTSAVIAILRDEPEGDACLQTTVAAERVRISAVSYVEAAAVIDRLGDPVLSRRLDELLDLLNIAIEPFDGVQARRARAAYRDFGRGSGHPARLNFGDCCAYALATSQGEPLLFKGDDFAHTDVHQVPGGPPVAPDS